MDYRRQQCAALSAKGLGIFGGVQLYINQIHFSITRMNKNYHGSKVTRTMDPLVWTSTHKSDPFDRGVTSASASCSRVTQIPCWINPLVYLSIYYRIISVPRDIDMSLSSPTRNCSQIDYDNILSLTLSPNVTSEICATLNVSSLGFSNAVIAFNSQQVPLYI